MHSLNRRSAKSLILASFFCTLLASNSIPLSAQDNPRPGSPSTSPRKPSGANTPDGASKMQSGPAATNGMPRGLSAENAATFAKLIDRDWKEKPEWAEMLSDILQGKPMEANTGWFKPSQKRLGWEWVADQFDKDKDARISPQEAKDFARVYPVFDRNRDGGITQRDFDWDEVSHVSPSKPSEAFFFFLDRNSNGRVERQEVLQWMALMDESKNGFLTPDEFSKGMAPLDQFRPNQADNKSKTGSPSSPAAEGSGNQSKTPPNDPNRMLNMLFQGELGSFSEGPKIGDPAPDFELSPLKAGDPVKLSSYFGKKIVVLNFGSFT